MDLRNNPSPLASEEAWANRASFESNVPIEPQGDIFSSQDEMVNFIQTYGILSIIVFQSKFFMMQKTFFLINLILYLLRSNSEMIL